MYSVQPPTRREKVPKTINISYRIRRLLFPLWLFEANVRQTRESVIWGNWSSNLIRLKSELSNARQTLAFISLECVNLNLKTVSFKDTASNKDI